jgi:hypothetical protein
MNDEKNAIYQNEVRHYRTLPRVNMPAMNTRSLSKVVQEKNEEYDIIVLIQALMYLIIRYITDAFEGTLV